ncbi:hypothetical protein F4781DRAFT_445681 [Annulohypoxylon bovei var. microspora]|nr:hypothetical protein F4781DRAFT_445681 [Annulohypoxylon bovei var. microspora]
MGISTVFGAFELFFSIAGAQNCTALTPSAQLKISDSYTVQDGSAAYVTFHGSWDRNPPDGFRLGKIKFADGQPVANVSDLEAVEYILQNQNTTKCPGACFRPVGLVFDKKGRLFMTSDQSGELFVLTGV